MPRLHSPLWPDHRIKPPYGSVEIDYGHPLAQGLRFALLYNDCGGDPLELVSRAQTFSPTTKPTYPSSGGIVLSDSFYIPRSSFEPNDISQPLTYMSKVTGDYRDSGRKYGLRRAYGGPIASFVWGAPVLVIEQTIANYQARSDFNIIAAGIQTETTGVSYDGSNTAAGAKVWVGRYGLQPTVEGGLASGSNWVANYPFYIDADTSLTRHFDYFWWRALSISEMAWVSADPYCFLREVKKRSYGFVGAAGASTPLPVFLNLQRQFRNG
jgi:hypothetical protein